jgi:hypothetical protein
MPTTHLLYSAADRSTYCAGWQSKLARVLVRDIRTIRRWKTGESPVPKVVGDWLREKTGETPYRRC